MNAAAVKQAQQKHSLDKILETKLSDDFYQELYDYVEHQQARFDLFGELGKKH